jgi:hypothetical protein
MVILRIEDIINILQAIRERPLLAMGDQPLAVVSFLSGFNILVGFAGFTTPRSGYNELYKEVVIAHGWEWDAGGPWHQMQGRGMSNEEIMKETLTIEIAYWKRSLPPVDADAVQESAVMYFSHFWTTEKDKSLLLGHTVEEGLSIIHNEAYVLIEDEDVWREVGRRMLAAGVKLMSKEDYASRFSEESEKQYSKWISDGKPDIDVSTKSNSGE